MRLLTSGIADDNVQSAEYADRIFDKFAAEGFVAQIARQRDARASRFLDEAHNLLCVLFFGRKIIDRHICAFARIGDRGGTAHAGIAAGDKRLAAEQAAGAAIACLTWSGGGSILQAKPGQGCVCFL